MYITQSNLETNFGPANVTRWGSFTEGAATPDAGRIAQAIATAETYANNALAGSMYVVPLVATGSGQDAEFLNAVAEWAGWWLWFTRGLKATAEVAKYYEDRKRRAEDVLLAISSGRRPIQAQIKATAAGGLNIPLQSNR